MSSAMFNELGGKIPVLTAVRPNGDESIENFEAAGGCRALMKQLEPLLDTKAMTCTGKTVGENLAGVTVANQEVIRPRDRAFSNEAPITILRGSLAPESAICKLGLRGPGRVSTFDGPAVVFDNGPDAIEAIQAGQIKEGDVLVVRGMGPKGGPGMAGPASMVVFAVEFRRPAEQDRLHQRRPAFGPVQQGPDGGGGIAGIRRSAGRWRWSRAATASSSMSMRAGST